MKYISAFVLLIICVLMVFPFLFVIIGASHDSGWAFYQPIRWTLGNSMFNNYTTIRSLFHVGRIIGNSIIVALATSLLSLSLTFMAAYGFKKYQFRYKKVLYAMFVASIFVPASGLLIGQLQTIHMLGIYGTLIGIVLPFIVNVRVFVYLQNISEYIPDDLLEAGRLDGARESQLFINVSLPMVKDKLFLAGFMLFVTSWNNFLIPMITINTRNNFTLPVMISALADPMRYDVGATFVSLLFSIIPIITVFIIFHKHIFEESIY